MEQSSRLCSKQLVIKLIQNQPRESMETKQRQVWSRSNIFVPMFSLNRTAQQISFFSKSFLGRTCRRGANKFYKYNFTPTTRYVNYNVCAFQGVQLSKSWISPHPLTTAMSLTSLHLQCRHPTSDLARLLGQVFLVRAWIQQMQYPAGSLVHLNFDPAETPQKVLPLFLSR